MLSSLCHCYDIFVSKQAPGGPAPPTLFAIFFTQFSLLVVAVSSLHVVTYLQWSVLNSWFTWYVGSYFVAQNCYLTRKSQHGHGHCFRVLSQGKWRPDHNVMFISFWIIMLRLQFTRVGTDILVRARRATKTEGHGAARLRTDRASAWKSTLRADRTEWLATALKRLLNSERSGSP